MSDELEPGYLLFLLSAITHDRWEGKWLRQRLPHQTCGGFLLQVQPTVQPAQTSQPEPVAQPVTVIRPAPIVPLTVKEGRKLLRSCLNTKETGAVHTALEQALPALLISQGGAASCA